MNPDECRQNNPKWSWARHSKGSASTPFEVSQMRDNNPCSTCQVYKHCKHEDLPFREPIKNVHYCNTKPRDVRVKGELINAKRQTGFTSVPVLDKEGQPRLDRAGNPRRNIIRVVYGRTVDLPRQVSR